MAHIHCSKHFWLATTFCGQPRSISDETQKRGWLYLIFISCKNCNKCPLGSRSQAPPRCTTARLDFHGRNEPEFSIQFLSEFEVVQLRHLRDVHPLHQVGECGQHCGRDAINHPMPARDEPTDDERAASRSRVPGRTRRGCATPSELTTRATWYPLRCGGCRGLDPNSWTAATDRHIPACPRGSACRTARYF